MMLLSGNIFAQQKFIDRSTPNFSGKWTLDVSKSSFNDNYVKFYKGNEGLICSSQLVISHKTPKLNIKELTRCYIKNVPNTISYKSIEDMTFYTDKRGEKNAVEDRMILSTKTE